jgi:hypothetical protein
VSDLSARVLSPATATIAEEFSKLLDLSSSQFISLRGSIDGAGSTSFFDRYISLMKLQGFDKCWVYPSRIGAPSASFRCDMKVPSGDVRSNLEKVVGLIRTAKPKEWTEEPGETNELAYLAKEGERKRSISVRINEVQEHSTTISIWITAAVLEVR